MDFYTLEDLHHFCVENAQMATLHSLIYAHFVGVLNEKRCKMGHPRGVLLDFQ